MLEVDVADLESKIASFVATGGGAIQLKLLIGNYLRVTEPGGDTQAIRLVRLPTAEAMGGVRNRLAYETFWRNPAAMIVALSEATRGSRSRIFSIVDSYVLTYPVRLCGADVRLRHLFVVEPDDVLTSKWRWTHKEYPPLLSELLVENTETTDVVPTTFDVASFDGALTTRLALSVQSRSTLPTPLNEGLLNTLDLAPARERQWRLRVPQSHFSPDEGDLVADNVRWITIGKDPGKNALNRIREAGWDNPDILVLRAQRVARASIDDVKGWLTYYWHMFEILGGTCRLKYCLALLEDELSLLRYLVSFPAMSGQRVAR